MEGKEKRLIIDGELWFRINNYLERLGKQKMRSKYIVVDEEAYYLAEVLEEGEYLEGIENTIIRGDRKRFNHIYKMIQEKISDPASVSIVK